uniref:Uncharacterized protein n=1 Tax=Ciona savignyi TaxID=51511 RepID=H2ZQP6_CIOSA
MWMMQSDEKPHQLLLQHNSTSLWLSCVILEGSGYVDHYTTNITGTCVAVLPDLSVATSNSKLEKYVWDGKTSEFNLKQTMQHPEKPVLSLSNLNQEPEALVGCTSTDMFIWNHMNGLMLQKFSLGDKGIAKSIVHTTCHEGLLNIVLKIKSRGELICCSLLCNPLNGNLQVIKKRKSRETQPRQQYYYKASSRFPFSDSALQGLLSQLNFQSFTKFFSS